MEKNKKAVVPKHVKNLLLTNFLDYFTTLSEESQEKYIDYAIDFVREYLVRNEGFTTPEQDEFLYKLQEFKVNCAYEARYGIKERIAKEKRPNIRGLMEDIEEDYLNCEFLDEQDLLEGSNFGANSTSKYGDGLARFASIILYRERAKAKVTGKSKGKNKLIKRIKNELIAKCSNLKETFAHEERSLQRILDEQFKMDTISRAQDMVSLETYDEVEQN